MQTQLEIALDKHFILFSRPVILSKVGEPLRVRFIALNVPVSVGQETPTSSAFGLQVFNKHGKQMGTLTAIRIEWNWEEPAGNVAEIERIMMKADFGIEVDDPKFGIPGLRTMITTEEHIKEMEAAYGKKEN